MLVLDALDVLPLPLLPSPKRQQLDIVNHLAPQPALDSLPVHLHSVEGVGDNRDQQVEHDDDHEHRPTNKAGKTDLGVQLKTEAIVSEDHVIRHVQRLKDGVLGDLKVFFLHIPLQKEKNDGEDEDGAEEDAEEALDVDEDLQDHPDHVPRVLEQPEEREAAAGHYEEHGAQMYQIDIVVGL